MTRHALDTPQFFLTAPNTCPYLPGREERKIFTHLMGPHALFLHDMLSQGGFRRSQNIAYRPACEGCKACISVRTCVDDFIWKKSFKRVRKRNQDLISIAKPAHVTSEHHALFQTYLNARHTDGGMASMSVQDFVMMVEDTHVDTSLIEYRLRTIDSGITGHGGELVGAVLTDRLGDGLSMVYSFFNPDLHDRSLGTFMILDHIKRALTAGLPYVYLGYWIDGSPTMDYKARFQPLEALGTNGWQLMED